MKSRVRKFAVLSSTIASSTIFVLSPLTAQQSALPKRFADPTAAEAAIAGHIVEPKKLPANPAALRVPAGYRVDVFAANLGHPRMIEVAADGGVYVTRRTEGDVVLLRDTNGDGRADSQRVVARAPLMHGIELDGRKVYLVAGQRVMTAPVTDDGGFGPMTTIIDDLPDTGQHSARDIEKGPDGDLYLSIGSTCNACTESSPESAAMLRVSPDGKQRTIFASGLRHTIGFGWQPRTGALWGMDHGIDWLGDTEQVEELNRIEQGKGYGWPYIYGMGAHNPQDDPPGELTMDELDRMNQRAVLGYDAHAAPMQMAFYRGKMFPAAEQGNAFVAMRGSWNRKDPSGYEVVRVRFDAAGNPQKIEPFLTGFLTRGGHTGRPVGIAEARDGALLVSDDSNGVIYRISHTGQGAAPAALSTPATGPTPLEQRPGGTVLAMGRAETATKAQFTVKADGFANRSALPMRFTAYGEDRSPALSWSGLPAATRSVAILMEDPDAASGKPFVHWTAWNIDPLRGSLPEAIAPMLQLPELGKLRQGLNTRGSVGYYGPRPPVGDAPHRYHFQLFALDAPLDLLPGANREALLAAMQGHVLAQGTIIGTYRQLAPPPKK